MPWVSRIFCDIVKGCQMSILKYSVVASVLVCVCSSASTGVLYFEDFESFDVGVSLDGKAGWEGWYGNAGAATSVSEQYAFSGTKSIEVRSSTDIVQVLDITAGKWVLTAMQYLPSGTNGVTRFHIQNRYRNGAIGRSIQWSFSLGDGVVGDDYDAGASASIIYDEWVELKLVIDLDNDSVEQYYDGKLFSSRAWVFSGEPEIQSIDLYGNGASSVYYDDIKIQDYLSSLILAHDPGPESEVTDVPRDVVLTWTPGRLADTHDIYFGTNGEDVANADRNNPLDVLVSRGQNEDAFYRDGRLDFEQIYYWRVDEVNGAPDFSILKGSLWSFTTEPYSIPITNITATASSSFGASLPEKSIDGSGLVDDLHGSSAPDMWISAGIPATIEYAFDRTYKLHELWVWNSNQLIEAFVGFGAKDVVVEHSLDGENWTVLQGVSQLAQAPGTNGYAHNNQIDFGGINAQYVRIAISSAHGIAPQVSLSEVRFYSIPVIAREPEPESGATQVAPDLTLSWRRNGREADHHNIYLGTDPGNLPQLGSVGDSSISTLAENLGLSQTYYWRVDEVNEAETPSTWVGEVWNFTTADSIVIDDMESYADAEFLEIWATWVDGFDDPANGALVGGAAGIPETEIVHGGRQSLPIDYGDGAASNSEATRTFAAAQDWSRHGVQGLVLYFHGNVTNTAGSLYVKINDTQVAYDGDPADLQRIGWHEWTIDLAALPAATRGAVSSLTIGIDSGGTGVVLIDDILLTPDAHE